MPLRPIQSQQRLPDVSGSLRPIQGGAPVQATLEEIQAKEARGETLSPAEQRVIFDAPMSMGRVWSGVKEGVGQVASDVGSAVKAGYNAFDMGDLVDPNAYAKLATTMGEGFARGTYDLGNVARMGYNKFLSPSKSATFAGDKDDAFRRWMERRSLNQGYAGVREPGEYLVEGMEDLPEEQRASKVGAELASYALDPTALGLPGAGLAARTGGKVAAKLGVQDVGKKLSTGVARVAEATGAGLKKTAQLPEQMVEGAINKVAGSSADASKVTHAGVRGAALVGAPIWTPLAVLKGTELTGWSLEKIGSLARHTLGKEKGLAFTRAQQLARDPNAPSWMRAAATAWDNTAGRIAPVTGDATKGALGGAAIGAGMGVASAETPEELGAAIGSGATIGGGMGAASTPFTQGQKRRAAKARTAAWFIDNQLNKGANPDALKKLDSATAFQAAMVDYVFEGALDINFMTGDEFAKVSNDPGAAAFWAEGKLYMNTDSPRLAGDFIHEVGHALAESEVASSPEIIAEVQKAAGGPQGMEALKDQYAAALLRARQAESERGAGKKIPTAEFIKNNRAEIEAEKARLADDSLRKFGDPEYWIYTEVFAETMMNRFAGKDLADELRFNTTIGQKAMALGQGLLESVGVKFKSKDGTLPTVFAETPDVVKNDGLKRLTEQYLKARKEFSTGRSTPVEQALNVTPEMVGQHPGVPVKDMPDGTKGNDFVTVDPSGRIVPRTRAQTRKLEQARAAEVDAALGDQPVDYARTMKGDVKKRRTISGLVQYTGTKMGPWFDKLRSYGADSKAAVKLVENLIDSGGTIRHWYQAISSGAGRGWRKNLKTLQGNLSVSDRESIPFGFIVSKPGTQDVGGKTFKKGGNILVAAFDLNALNQRAAEWQKRTGDFSLDLWNGSIADFTADLRQYMKNLIDEVPGETGIGVDKKNAMNAFMIGDNRAHANRNPLRDILRGKDKQGLVRTYRLDRMENVREGSNPAGYPGGDYVSMVLNKSPMLQQAANRIGDVEGDLQQAAPRLWVDEVKQKVSSKKTSVAGQVPARSFYSRLPWKEGTTNIDIGGGQSDAFTDFLQERGVNNLVWDPFWKTQEENNAVANQVAGGQADTATVNNVLNVIKESKNRDRVVAQAADAIKPGGVAFFKIYEGPHPGNSGERTKSGWQNNRKTQSYIREVSKYFDEVVRRGEVIIAKKPKKDAVQQATPKSEQQKVVSAAIRLPDGRVVTGPSHFLAMLEVDATGNLMDDLPADAFGFQTNDGMFVSRDEAAQIAAKADQVNPQAPQPMRERLRSEALKGNEDVYNPDRVEAAQKAAEERQRAAETSTEVVPGQNAPKSSSEGLSVGPDQTTPRDYEMARRQAEGTQQAAPKLDFEDQDAVFRKYGLKGADEIDGRKVIGLGEFYGGQTGKELRRTLILDNPHPEAFQVELLLDKKGQVQRDPAGKPRARQIQYDILMAPGPAKMFEGLDMSQVAEFAELPPETLKDLAWAAIDETVDPGGMDARLKDAMPYLNFTERRRVQAAIERNVHTWYSDKIVEEFNRMMEMPGVAEGMGWYARMRDGLKRVFKDDAKLFAQLLGATSAKTAVELNFRYAVEAYEQLKSGAFAEQIRNYRNMRRFQKRLGGFGLQEWLARKGYLGKEGVDWVRIPYKLDKDGNRKERQPAAAGKIAGLKNRDKPMTDAQAIEIYGENFNIDVRRPDGERFGQNGDKVMQVLGGDWEDLTIPNSPKTPNFAGNLYGRTLQATIDVWAARLMRRIGWEGYTDGAWRLQPKSETGVNAQDFALSQLAFADAAAKLNMNPDDLQAIVWFGEKHIWDERGWTGEEGGEKSSYDDPFAIYYPEGRDRSSADANAIMKFRGDLKKFEEFTQKLKDVTTPEHQAAFEAIEKAAADVALAEKEVAKAKAAVIDNRSSGTRQAAADAKKDLAAKKKVLSAAKRAEVKIRSKEYINTKSSLGTYTKEVAKSREIPEVQFYEKTGI